LLRSDDTLLLLDNYNDDIECQIKDAAECNENMVDGTRTLKGHIIVNIMKKKV
jgi:hypothetical protein